MALKRKGGKPKREGKLVLPQGYSPTVHHESEFEQFRQTLRDDQLPHAWTFFQMACEHKWNTIIIQAPLDPAERREKVRCSRCELLLPKSKSVKQMRLSEWDRYCPEGMDAFDWQEQFTHDKSLWPYIYDEAEHTLIAHALGETEAA